MLSVFDHQIKRKEGSLRNNNNLDEALSTIEGVAPQAFHIEASSNTANSTSPMQRRELPESDYYRRIVQGGADRYTSEEASIYSNNGVNDATMSPKHNLLSNGFNYLVTEGMDMLGYDTRRRGAREDNDFYRDYAQFMPGYDIDGIPSGAWAQDAATNHIGHGAGPGSAWDNIRRDLVDLERTRIEERQADGESGRLSYWDLYTAHETAYDRSGGGGNGFIDPGSFAMAVYAAPLLNELGIDAGPITGASIDLFNNPDDTATEGWLKRMGLAGGEMIGGTALAGKGVGDFLTGSPITGGAEILGGAGLAAAGAFGAGWNTASAFGHGMLGEWADGAADTAEYAINGISGAASSVGDWATSQVGAAADYATSTWTPNIDEIDWGRTLNPFAW
jgi:hypothetical protein